MSFSKKNLVRPVVATLIFVMLFAATWIGTATALDVGYSYESEVGAHFDRAYTAQTPETFIDEIDLALRGMEEIGLEDDMSGRWFSWQQTPNRDVGWLVQWLNDMQDRAYAVIEWRDAIFEDDTTNELMGDVYEDKMRHLREKFYRDVDATGPLWIAGAAYYRVYHPLYYWVHLWLPLLWAFAIIFCLKAPFTIKRTWGEYRRERRRREEIERERVFQSDLGYNVGGYRRAMCPVCHAKANLPDHAIGTVVIRCSSCDNTFTHFVEGEIRVD